MGAVCCSEFTYGHLRSLIKAMKANFDMPLFSTVEESLEATARNVLFLRHDVDLCLKRALYVAEIEHDMGVTATYFVMSDSPSYSLLENTQAAIAKRIISLGHEIGLHHVSSVMEHESHGRDTLQSDIRSAHNRLEQLIDAPVRSISFHRPNKAAIQGPLRIDGLINAYAKELMTAYVSDSAGCWKQGDPLARIAAAQDRVMQVLIHPIWWGKEHMEPMDRLQEFFEARTLGLWSSEVEAFDRVLSNTLGRVRRRGCNGVSG